MLRNEWTQFPQFVIFKEFVSCLFVALLNKLVIRFLTRNNHPRSCQQILHLHHNSQIIIIANFISVCLSVFDVFRFLFCYQVLRRFLFVYFMQCWCYLFRLFSFRMTGKIQSDFVMPGHKSNKTFVVHRILFRWTWIATFVCLLIFLCIAHIGAIVNYSLSDKLNIVLTNSDRYMFVKRTIFCRHRKGRKFLYKELSFAGSCLLKTYSSPVKCSFFWWVI